MDIQSALKDRPSTGKFLLLQLPLCILEPVCKANTVATDIVLILATFPALILLQLFEIGKVLCRLLDTNFLSVNGLAKQLFGRDLNRRRALVLDPRRAP